MESNVNQYACEPFPANVVFAGHDVGEVMSKRRITLHGLSKMEYWVSQQMLMHSINEAVWPATLRSASLAPDVPRTVSNGALAAALEFFALRHPAWCKCGSHSLSAHAGCFPRRLQLSWLCLLPVSWGFLVVRGT